MHGFIYFHTYFTYSTRTKSTEPVQPKYSMLEHNLMSCVVGILKNCVETFWQNTEISGFLNQTDYFGFLKKNISPSPTTDESTLCVDETSLGLRLFTQNGRSLLHYFGLLLIY